MTERLYQLITQAESKYLEYVESERRRARDVSVSPRHEIFKLKSKSEFISEYLVNNGTIVRQCRVGDTVYRVQSHTNTIVEHTVRKIKTTEAEDKFLTVYYCDTPEESPIIFTDSNIGREIFVGPDAQEQAQSLVESRYLPIK